MSYIELIFLHSSCIIDKLYKCKRKRNTYTYLSFSLGFAYNNKRPAMAAKLPAPATGAKPAPLDEPDLAADEPPVADEAPDLAAEAAEETPDLAAEASDEAPDLAPEAAEVAPDLAPEAAEAAPEAAADESADITAAIEAVKANKVVENFIFDCN